MLLPGRLNILGQYLISLWVRASEHVEWRWYCLWGHCFSSVLKKKEKEIRRWPKNGANEDHNTHTHTHTHTHTNLMTDLRMGESDDYKRFCGCIVHHLMSYSRLLPLQWIKEIHVRSSHSQSVFVHYARPFGNCKCLWRPAAHKCHICSVLGRYVTARQTATEWILHKTVQYSLCQSNLIWMTQYICR